MVMLVVGGSGSGKSAWAEDLACALHVREEGPLLYLAAMDPAGEEGRRRVERHRALRAGKGFATLERPLGPAPGELPPGSTLLLEDLENLLANHLYAPEGRGLPGALEAVEALAAKGRHLVLVGNTIFSDGEEYPPATREYLTLLGRLQGRAAALADGAAEVVCGIPVWMKGKEEWFR